GDQLASLRARSADMQARAVECLLILGANPVYDAPADLDFAGALQQVALRVHLGLYADETARLCHWHVPAAHHLERWGAVRAYDGTTSLIQPLIAPLYGGRTLTELLAAFGGQSAAAAHELVRGQWQQSHAGGSFDTFWEQALRDGVIPGTAARTKTVGLRGDWDPGATPLPRP